MTYHPDDMALYIYSTFGIKKDKDSVESNKSMKEYSVSEIYNQMCVNCHGKKAEGNPKKKGPSLNDMSKQELSYELFDLVANGSQSSGSNHEVMEHNQKKIVKKGMTYHPDDMASYIYFNFNLDAKK